MSLLLPETAFLVEAVPEVLPDSELLFLDDVLPERPAIEEVFLLVAELLL